MDGVVEEVAEGGHRSLGRDGVVVGAEEGDELRVARERRADAGEGVTVDEDVRVDEDDELGRRSPHPGVASHGRAGAGRLGDDDDLVGRHVGREDGVEAGPEREGGVGGGDHHRERG